MRKYAELTHSLHTHTHTHRELKQAVISNCEFIILLGGICIPSPYHRHITRWNQGAYGELTVYLSRWWYLSRLQHDYSVPTGTYSLTHPLPVFITGLHAAPFHYRGAAAKMCHTFLNRREQKTLIPLLLLPQSQ